MLREYVRTYYLQHNRNCAETILCAANDYWALGLDPQVFHALGSFGGGLGCGSLCGALAGSAAVLGILTTKTVAHENPLLRRCAPAWSRSFGNGSAATSAKSCSLSTSGRGIAASGWWSRPPTCWKSWWRPTVWRRRPARC